MGLKNFLSCLPLKKIQKFATLLMLISKIRVPHHVGGGLRLRISKVLQLYEVNILFLWVSVMCYLSLSVFSGKIFRGEPHPEKLFENFTIQQFPVY